MSGAAAGGLIGGPGGAALGAGAGYAGGRIYELNGQNNDLVQAISSGDVEGIAAEIVRERLVEHTSGLDAFTTNVKRILVAVGVLLLAYLCVSFFWTKKCVRETKEQLTRAPFPKRHESKKT